MSATFTYDLATDVGKVRRKIGDYDFSVKGTSLTESRAAWTCNFADEEITSELTTNSSNVLLTAAALLEDLAGRIGSVVPVKVGNWSDSPQVAADSLRSLAASYRLQVNSEAAVEEVNPAAEP